MKKMIKKFINNITLWAAMILFIYVCLGCFSKISLDPKLKGTEINYSGLSFEVDEKNNNFKYSDAPPFINGFTNGLKIPGASVKYFFLTSWDSITISTNRFIQKSESSWWGHEFNTENSLKKILFLIIDIIINFFLAIVLFFYLIFKMFFLGSGLHYCLGVILAYIAFPSLAKINQLTKQEVSENNDQTQIEELVNEK